MDENLINKSMLFCANYFNSSCHNFGKPVYFHCIKVAMTLYTAGYNDKIIVGRVLHDLVEDTDCSLNDIEMNFGEDMAKLIKVLSFDPKIQDPYEQSKLMLDSCLQYGIDALIIKCADLYENGKYFGLVKKIEVREYLIKELEYFLKISDEYIKDEPIFKLLKSQFIQLKND